MNHRFKVGDHVRVIGVLADFYPGKMGTVAAVEPNRDGIRELDLYVIKIPGVEMGDTKLADFELAPAEGGPPKPSDTVKRESYPA